jgi:DedD protein
MRDVEGLREKLQVSLEGRQIAALSVGALLLLCSVFALGLALGRRLSQETPRPAELSALDAQAAEAGARKAPAQPNSAEVAAQKPARPAEAPPQKAAKESAAPKPVQTAAVKPRPAPETALADTKKAAVAIVPPPPRELVVPPPAASGPISLTPPPRDIGAYTVQIGASPDRAEALRLENRARAAGYKPYSVEANLGAKGTWYRVRIGSFPDKDRALRYRSDVERELRQAAIVMASH